MASLGNDLAQIRKKRNLTLNDLQEAIKIPKRILRSIEDDSIFTDFKENPTYIRSYVRSYAKALSIDDKQIIHALNKREKNDYSGSLQHIAGIDSPESKDEDEKQETTRATSDQDDDINHDRVPDFSFEEEKEKATSSPNTSSGPRGSSDRSDVRSVNWAEMGQQFQPLETERSKIWFGLVIVLLIALGGSFFYFFNTASNSNTANTPNNTSNQESTASLSTDSLELNITPTEDSDTATTEPAENNTEAGPSLQNETLDALPDTLNMIVYAAYGKLEPVRVYTDIMGDTNPYWIEQGDAVGFDFVNEIRIRGQYSNIALIINGHAIQDFRDQFYNPETRLIEINRSYFEGDSQWLEPGPDSLGIDAPPPSVIRERPTYN